MVSHESWDTAPPEAGKDTFSAFVEVPGLHVPTPLSQSPNSLNYGWVQYPDGLLVPDDFSNNPNWIDRELDLDEQPDPDLLKMCSDLAEVLVNWARANTFESFDQSVLGIAIEFEDTLLTSPDNTDPDELNAIPHLDWVNEIEPSVIVLGARGLPNIGYAGQYRYLGTSKLDNDVTKYRDQASTMQLLTPEPGILHATDARRGLHSRPLLAPGYSPIRRTFIRSFIARRSDV